MLENDLTDLPNISFVLGKSLKRVGIASAGALKRMGAEVAWNLLHKNGHPVSIQTLLALEGAIQRVSWQALPADRRSELVRFAAGRC